MGRCFLILSDRSRRQIVVWAGAAALLTGALVAAAPSSLQAAGGEPEPATGSTAAASTVAGSTPESVTVLFVTHPETGRLEGPIDPVSRRYYVTERDPHGVLRVRLDPETGKPVLKDAAAPALAARTVPAAAPAASAPARPVRPPAEDAVAVVFSPIPASAIAVQVASFASETRLAEAWVYLSRKYPALAARTPYLQEDHRPSGQPYRRLLATGYLDEPSALAACRMLKAGGDDCMVVRK